MDPTDRQHLPSQPRAGRCGSSCGPFAAAHPPCSTAIRASQARALAYHSCRRYRQSTAGPYAAAGAARGLIWLLQLPAARGSAPQAPARRTHLVLVGTHTRLSIHRRPLAAGCRRVHAARSDASPAAGAPPALLQMVPWWGKSSIHRACRRRAKPYTSAWLSGSAAGSCVWIMQRLQLDPQRGGAGECRRAD